jgi:dipeptidyl-peptidase III
MTCNISWAAKTDNHALAVGDFLQKLHIYKSTADVEHGAKFFTDMSSVGLEYWGSKVRNVVLANKQPRKVFVQANTYLDEGTGKVTLKQYDASCEGIIQSWADRQL